MLKWLIYSDVIVVLSDVYICEIKLTVERGGRLVIEFVERKELPVEPGVGEVVAPVAENNDVGAGFERVVYEHMLVAEHVVVNLGVLAAVVGGERYEAFAVGAEKLRRLFREVARVCRPAVGEGDSPPRMDGAVEPLAEAVAECGAEHAERPWQTANTVTMGHVEVVAEYALFE